MAFLVRNNGGLLLPLNKVARFIAQGDEHSVHYFAGAYVKQTLHEYAAIVLG